MKKYIVILLDAKDPSEDAREEMFKLIAKEFEVPIEEIRKNFSSFPATVRIEESKDYAEEYAKVLRDLGGLTEIVEFDEEQMGSVEQFYDIKVLSSSSSTLKAISEDQADKIYQKMETSSATNESDKAQKTTTLQSTGLSFDDSSRETKPKENPTPTPSKQAPVNTGLSLSGDDEEDEDDSEIFEEKEEPKEQQKTASKPTTAASTSGQTSGLSFALEETKTEAPKSEPNKTEPSKPQAPAAEPMGFALESAPASTNQTGATAQNNHSPQINQTPQPVQTAAPQKSEPQTTPPTPMSLGIDSTSLDQLAQEALSESAKPQQASQQNSTQHSQPNSPSYNTQGESGSNSQSTNSAVTSSEDDDSRPSYSAFTSRTRPSRIIYMKEVDENSPEDEDVEDLIKQKKNKTLNIILTVSGIVFFLVIGFLNYEFQKSKLEEEGIKLTNELEAKLIKDQSKIISIKAIEYKRKKDILSKNTLIWKKLETKVIFEALGEHQINMEIKTLENQILDTYIEIKETTRISTDIDLLNRSRIYLVEAGCENIFNKTDKFKNLPENSILVTGKCRGYLFSVGKKQRIPLYLILTGKIDPELGVLKVDFALSSEEPDSYALPSGDNLISYENDTSTKVFFTSSIQLDKSKLNEEEEKALRKFVEDEESKKDPKKAKKKLSEDSKEDDSKDFEF